MKLTPAQLKVLGALELDAEKPLQSVARETRLKQSNVQRILAGLIQNEIIDGKSAIIDIARLGLIEYAFALSIDGKHSADALVRHLERHRAVSWIAEVGASYDLMLNVVARHPSEVVRFFDRLSSSFPELIRKKVTYQRTERIRFWRHYLNPGRSKGARYHLGKSSAPIIIDERDKTILEVFAKLKHESYRDLAQQIGIPIASFLRRVKALKDSGLILGFGYRLNLERLGIEQYRILISVASNTEECFRRLREFCGATGRVKLLTRTLGAYDFDLEVDVFSPRETKELIDDLKQLLGAAGVTLETVPIFRHRKFISFPVV